MTYDDEIMALVNQAEQCMKKYDKSITDVLNRMMEFHSSWVSEHETL